MTYLPTTLDMRDAVVMAAKPIKENFRRSVQTDTKKDGTLVTAVDIQVNDALRDWADTYDVDYIGEEGNGKMSGRDHIIVVDPLDGTGAYHRGLFGTTSVMTLMERQNELWFPKRAIIHEPGTGWTWLGSEKKRTMLFESPGAGYALSEKQRSVTAPYRTTTVTWRGVPMGLSEVRKAFEQHMDIQDQSIGGIALCGGLLASGLMEASLFAGTSAIETVAMMLVARGAGNIALDLHGNELTGFELKEDKAGKLDFHMPYGALICANQELADMLLEIIAKNRPHCPESS